MADQPPPQDMPPGYAPPAPGYAPPGPGYPPPGPGYPPPGPGYANPGGYGPPQPTWQQPPPQQQQQQQQQQTTVVIQQQAAPTMVVAAVFGPNPVTTVCPGCQKQIVTHIQHTIGTHAIGWCVALFCLGLDAGCCFIPFCMDSCKDVSHDCPHCGAHIADWERP